MTDLQAFAFVVLPLVVAAIGGIAVLLFEWRHPQPLVTHSKANFPSPP